MVKHNNIIPNAHFKKQWQRRVKTWFDQPMKKKARRAARAAKAQAAAPRPAGGLLRPVVHCQTVRYNRRVRAGKGFTLEELKAAGISRHQARSVGIAVDFRRRNKCEESLAANVERLQAYKAKLIVFPIRSNSKPKAGDASVEQQAAATQLQGNDVMPIVVSKPVATFEKITDEMRGFNAFKTLRQEWINKKFHGQWKKAAEEEAEAKK